MRQPPPSRYKVVERGRRLEVIDTHTGRPVSHAPRPADRSEGARGGVLDLGARKPDKASDGPAGVEDGAAFTTRRWFDAKAPRRIRTNFATRSRLDQLRFGLALAIALIIAFCFLFWPFFPILVIAALATPRLRTQLRDASTRWIDTLDQAA